VQGRNNEKEGDPMKLNSARLLQVVVVVLMAAAGLFAFGLASDPAVATTCTDPPANLSPPAISGSPTVGATLTGSIGSWDDGGCPPVTYTVSWFRGGTSVRGPITLPSGVTTDNYVVQSADQGYSLVFQVVASNSHGNATASSPPFAIPGPPPPPPPPAAITLTRTGDGVSIYQNLQGRYYISDACHTNGTSTDSGTIGPAYIYRVDLDGQELVAPIASAPRYPSTGLGVFLADLYEGNPNDTPYLENDGVTWHPGQGAFESVQGNVCQGDMNNGPFTHGSGVSSSSVDAIGNETQAPEGGYLWVHYTVNLADPFGRQFAVLYWYRFYANEVDVWTKVIACPDGTCHHDGRGSAPFIKMPKFQHTVSAPAMDYQYESCYDVNGNWLRDAGQVDYPNGPTARNHCPDDTRGRLDIFFSRFGHQPFRLTGRSQTLANFGPDQPTYAWETSPPYGLDKWASVGQNRTHLAYSKDLNQDNNCGGSPGTPVHSWNDNMRRWEMGGDNPDATWLPGGEHFWPYKTIFALFKGWEDGNGPNNCRSLFNNMISGESYANFFRIRNG
jgi:hypothetical protein